MQIQMQLEFLLETTRDLQNASITEVEAVQRQKWLQSQQSTNRIEFLFGSARMHVLSRLPSRKKEKRKG